MVKSQGVNRVVDSNVFNLIRSFIREFDLD